MKMSLSIDGFVAGPNGEKDWLFRSSDEESRAWAVARSWEAGLIIMGRKSFETMAPYWPTATGPFAAPMNEIPKGVFTLNRRITKLPAQRREQAVSLPAQSREHPTCRVRPARCRFVIDNQP